MLDAVSIDHLRVFIAAAETGSFSAAGRRVGRAQSVVSQTIANLEGQLSLKLFSREKRLPELTDAGRGLLQTAREVVANLDRFKAQAKGLASGLEPSLAIVLNVLFPPEVLAAAVRDFHAEFPDTPLRVVVEGMDDVVTLVLSGEFDFGVRGPIATTHPELHSDYLLSVDYDTVVSSHHPLAQVPVPVSAPELARHVQLVLSDRSRLLKTRHEGIVSDRIWRISDLATKHAFLRSGVGWGGMPAHLVGDDIASGILVPLVLQENVLATAVAMSAVYRGDRPPGPAARWLIARLKRSL
jgi:DNA-binding transcriptional LysR family regulator